MKTAPTNLNVPRRARAFTLVELCIGMAFTGMLATVVAGFTLASAATWRAVGDEDALRLSSESLAGRVTPTLQAGLRVTQVSVGDLAAPVAQRKPFIFFWRADGLFAANDRYAQLGEMAAVEFDPATGTLWYYAAPAASDLGAAQLTEANQTLDEAALVSSATFTQFKAKAWVLRRPLFGSGTLVTNTDLSRLTAATFTDYPAVSGTKPGVGMSLTFDRGLSRVTTSTRFTLRGPMFGSGS